MKQLLLSTLTTIFRSENKRIFKLLPDWELGQRSNGTHRGNQKVATASQSEAAGCHHGVSRKSDTRVDHARLFHSSVGLCKPFSESPTYTDGTNTASKKGLHPSNVSVAIRLFPIP